MRTARTILGILLLLTPFTTAALAGSEVHITRDGVALVTGVKVMQIAGTTLYTRLYWGDAYVRLLVKTNSSTKFYRGTGEVTKLSEVSVGNMLDMTGQLESGSENLVLIATTVKNSSVQKQQATLSGRVVSVDLSGKIFVINSSKYGLVTVNTSSKTQFTKGNRALDLDHVKIGDTITKTTGDYDLTAKTLVAMSVVTYVDMNLYKPQNFQGVLQAISGTSVPASLQVGIGGISYKVNVTVDTAITNKNKTAVLLSRFVPGDTIRLYGTVREIDELVIDAEIVRNMSL